MADELVFPASNTLSLIDDLTSSMMNEEMTHDINPSFPQSEGSINIPEIIPPIICPKDTNTTFNQAAPEPYRPMRMEEPGELTVPLDVPLTTNINEPMNFSNVQNNPNVPQEPILRQHIQSPLASNNSMNFVNPNSHVSPIQNVQNTHCLVIGGQRVPISTPSQHNSSVINIKHAANANSPLLQTTHAMHSSSNVNVDNKLKQTMLVKAPMNEHVNIPNKPPMKGQIIKTPDQRLMFVTEVNGRRVGYLIQQPKQNNTQNNIPAQNNIPTQNNNIPNTHFSRVQASVQTYVNEHLENKKNQDGNILSSGTSETTNVDNQIKSASPINFTLDENKEIIMRHSENITKTTEPLLKTDMKSLREKLLNLRNPLNSKNQLNSKSSLTFPSMRKPAEKSGDEYVVCADNAPLPDTLSVDSSSVQTLPEENIEDSTSNEIISHNDDNEESNHSNEMQEEEEGQEIEFSENDLTADLDGTDQSCSPDYEMGEGDANNEEENTTAEIRSRTTSTDEEDCVPLSMLKIDTNDNSLSPKEESPPSSKTKRGKNSKKVKADGKSAKKEGKAKSRKKKDSRKPKKPIIAYQLFFRDIQKDVRTENPQLHFGEISHLVSKRWEALEDSDKKKYVDEHEELKVDYAEKIEVYKELIAQEEASCAELVASPVLQEFDSIQAVDNKDVSPPKKKGKRGKKRKLEIKLKVDLDNSLGENEFSIEGEQSDIKDNKQEEESVLKINDKQELDDNPPSSPSLPSSSSPSSEDEEDSETAITRIREKAAQLHKYLKQQRIVVTQKKSKQAKKVRPTKIEVKELPPLEDNKEDGKSETKVEDELNTPDLIADITEIEETVDEKKDALKEDMKQEELESPTDEMSDIDKAEESTDITGENDTLKDESDLMEVEDHVMENNGDMENDGDNLKDKLINHDNEDIEDNSFVEEPIHSKKTHSKGDSENDDLSEDEVINSYSRKKSPRIKKMEGSEKSKKGRDSKKTNFKGDSENEELSGDEVINSYSRKKSTRIKKMEESEEKSRKGRDPRIEDEKSMRENDEEGTRSRRSKKKRLDYTEKSDSEEESNNSQEHVEDFSSNNINSAGTHTNEKEKSPEIDSKISSPTKDLSSQLEEESAVQSNEHEVETSNNNTSPKIEETKPAVEQSSLKNTFRIPKKSGSTNDSGLLALRGPRICIRHTCDKPAVTSRERGGQYCGNECLVLYCREVFSAWVIDREMEESKT